jgi:hypothetical protein
MGLSRPAPGRRYTVAIRAHVALVVLCAAGAVTAAAPARAAAPAC